MLFDFVKVLAQAAPPKWCTRISRTLSLVSVRAGLLMAAGLSILGSREFAQAQTDQHVPLNRLFSIQVLKWRSRSAESLSFHLNAGDLKSRLEAFFANPSLAIPRSEAHRMLLAAERPIHLVFNLDGELIVAESNRSDHPLLDEDRDIRLSRVGSVRGSLLESYLSLWLEHTAARLAKDLVQKETSSGVETRQAQIRLQQNRQAIEWDLGSGADKSATSRSQPARTRAVLLGQGRGSLAHKNRLAGLSRSALLANAALLPIFGSKLDANLAAAALPRLFSHPGFEEDSEAPSQLFRAIESLEWALRVITSDGGRFSELPFRAREFQRLTGVRWPNPHWAITNGGPTAGLSAASPFGCSSIAFSR